MLFNIISVDFKFIVSSSIQRIHFDGTNSISSDLCYQWLFNDKNVLRFLHLKSFILTRCGSIEPVIQSLVYLIKYQLNELTLTFDKQIFTRFHFLRKHLLDVSYKEKQLNLMKELVCRLFSSQCQLPSLRLDISSEFHCGTIHRCLSSNSDLSPSLIQDQVRSCNITLRRLHIRLNHSHFLESLIEYVPNLEQISVEFDSSLEFDTLWKANIEALRQSNENWFNKVPKLQYFSLKTFIDDDLEFIYLKWLLNNVNYVKKFRIHIEIGKLVDRKCQNIWKCLIDANFIRKYCLPDRIPNLIDFNFYICSPCQLSSNDIEKIMNSFKIHSFFISHQWTGVKCLYDSIISCQHLFSVINKFQFSDNRINSSYIFNLLRFGDTCFNSYPSLHLFLEQFNEVSPNVSHINVYRSKLICHFDDPLINNGIPNELRINALNTVRYAEFCLPSCHNGYETIHIGKRLVPFISTYMPHLQTLRLWRPDDFSWTTVRPDYKRHCDDLLILQWLRSLQTPESIVQHVVVFEQDLCQLIDKLKDFNFLDIYGEIHCNKVEPYQLMVQARFPHSRVDVEISRFRLWL
ncbi:unnamed protein product [Rotaria magnacalcarata]